MSRTERRRLLLLGAGALALRLACAAVTELNPLFPAYYYTDAAETETAAARTLATAGDAEPYVFNGTLNQRLQVEALLKLYGVFGHRPFAAKAFNALAGAAAAMLLAAGLAPAFGARPALLAGAFWAAWPSAVFFTSHHLKEAPTAALAWGGLWGLMSLLARPAASPRAAAAAALASACGLFGAGLYRNYVLLSLCAGFGAAFAWSLARRTGPRGPLLAGLLLCLVLPLSYKRAANGVQRLLTATAGGGSIHTRVELVPLSADARAPGVVHHPTSPQGISGFRQARQFSDKRSARLRYGRDIGTQIFPEQSFRDWADILLYLPKGAFYVLFMPLPGLYPVDGSLGRFAASLENAALLVLALAALAGLARGPRTPERLAPLGFFAVMTAGAALLEFDLGAATRHKLLYLPMLFPFAAETALRWRKKA